MAWPYESPKEEPVLGMVEFGEAACNFFLNPLVREVEEEEWIMGGK